VVSGLLCCVREWWVGDHAAVVLGLLFSAVCGDASALAWEVTVQQAKTQEGLEVPWLLYRRCFLAITQVTRPHMHHVGSSEE
jgi:hypothetical protein